MTHVNKQKYEYVLKVFFFFKVIGVALTFIQSMYNRKFNNGITGEGKYCSKKYTTKSGCKTKTKSLERLGYCRGSADIRKDNIK